MWRELVYISQKRFYHKENGFWSPNSYYEMRLLTNKICCSQRLKKKKKTLKNLFQKLKTSDVNILEKWNYISNMW